MFIAPFRVLTKGCPLVFIGYRKGSYTLHRKGVTPCPVWGRWGCPCGAVGRGGLPYTLHRKGTTPLAPWWGRWWVSCGAVGRGGCPTPYTAKGQSPLALRGSVGVSLRCGGSGRSALHPTPQRSATLAPWWGLSLQCFGRAECSPWGVPPLLTAPPPQLPRRVVAVVSRCRGVFPVGCSPTPNRKPPTARPVGSVGVPCGAVGAGRLPYTLHRKVRAPCPLSGSMGVSCGAVGRSGLPYTLHRKGAPPLAPWWGRWWVSCGAVVLWVGVAVPTPYTAKGSHPAPWGLSL